MDESGGDDPFERAFRVVESAWDDDAAHRRFIAFCAAQSALGEAGRRYRSVRENDPARAERAKRWSDAVLAAAMQNMKLAREHPEPPRTIKAVGWLSLIISAVLIGYGVLALLRQSSQ